MTALYLLKAVYRTFSDICLLGVKEYFKSFTAMYDTVVLIALCLFVYYAGSTVVSQLEQDVTDAFIETLRLVEITIILLLNVQLFRYLKIFKFFQSFIR